MKPRQSLKIEKSMRERNLYRQNLLPIKLIKSRNQSSNITVHKAEQSNKSKGIEANKFHFSLCSAKFNTSNSSNNYLMFCCCQTLNYF